MPLIIFHISTLTFYELLSIYYGSQQEQLWLAALLTYFPVKTLPTLASLAVKRIMQEARELANDPSTDYHAAPLEVRLPFYKSNA